MGFRFSRRLRIAPGVHLNLGLKGASLSLGPRGAGVTIGRRGVHGHVGLPGSGLSYRARLDGRNTATADAPTPPPRLPGTVRLRFENDLSVTLLDGDSVVLVEPVLSATRAAYRAQLLDALDARACDLNQTGRTLADLHLATPPPMAAAPYPRPKPLKPRDPRSFAIDDAARAGADAAWSAYMETLAHWRAAKADHERLGGDPGAAVDTLEARLQTVAWPRETFISLDFDASRGVIVADVDLPEIETMPDTTIVVARGEVALTARPLTPSALRKSYQRHIFAIAFRIVGEAFAASAAVRRVELAGYTQRVSPATGAIEDTYILAFAVDRDSWRTIDFDALDRVDPQLALLPFRQTTVIDSGGISRRVAPAALA